MKETDYRIDGLNSIFTEQELLSISDNKVQVISVLSYFATSLFGINKADEVLWNITENCIARLNLEDCVIYLMDDTKSNLVQKAAYGNKNPQKRKILSPITIPLGSGMVGTVAATGTAEMIGDLQKEKRYIVDDIPRNSELTVPLLLNDEVIGVIDSEHSQKNFFTREHLLLFQLIAQLTVKKLSHILQNKKSSFTNDNAYYQEFRKLLEKDKVYRDQELSLSSAASKLNISANYLSQLVNKLSKTSFSDYINSYRVEEASVMLNDPDYNNYTITGIGLEAGFKSKSAFYSAFKKLKEMTPSQCRMKS